MRRPALNDPYSSNNIANLEAEIEHPKHAKIVPYKHRPRKESPELSPKIERTDTLQEASEPKKKPGEHFREIWLWADSKLNRDSLIPGDEGGVDVVLNALATAPITHVGILDIGDYESGTSQKWIGFLEGGQQIMLKIVWYLS